MVSLSDQSTAGGTTRVAGRDRPPAWPLWLFRVVVTVEAVLAFDQAVFAGQFIAGDYGALNSHETGAGVTSVMLLVETVAAVLLWRPGRGPRWPMLAGLGLFLLTGAQIGMGYARVLAVHVPLGVTIIALDALVLVWAWRYRPGRAAGGPAQNRLARNGDGGAR